MSDDTAVNAWRCLKQATISLIKKHFFSINFDVAMLSLDYTLCCEDKKEILKEININLLTNAKSSIVVFI